MAQYIALSSLVLHHHYTKNTDNSVVYLMTSLFQRSVLHFLYTYGFNLFRTSHLDCYLSLALHLSCPELLSAHVNDPKLTLDCPVKSWDCMRQ